MIFKGLENNFMLCYFYMIVYQEFSRPAIKGCNPEEEQKLIVSHNPLPHGIS